MSKKSGGKYSRALTLFGLLCTDLGWYFFYLPVFPIFQIFCNEHINYFYNFIILPHLKRSCGSHEQGCGGGNIGITACCPPLFLWAPFSVLLLTSLRFLIFLSTGHGPILIWRKRIQLIFVLSFFSCPLYGESVCSNQMQAVFTNRVTFTFTLSCSCCEPHFLPFAASGYTSECLSSQTSLSPGITLGTLPYGLSPQVPLLKDALEDSIRSSHHENATLCA